MFVTAAIRKLAGHVGSFLRAREPVKLYMIPAESSSNCVVRSKLVFLKMKCATQNISSASHKRVPIVVPK